MPDVDDYSDMPSSDIFMLGKNEEPDDGPPDASKLPAALRKALISKFGQESFDAQYPTAEAESAPPVDAPEAPVEDTPSEGGESEAPSDSLPPAQSPPAEAQTDGFVISDDPEQAALAAAPDTAPAAVIDDLDLNDLFSRFNGGTKPSREQMVNLLNLVQQIGQLNPEQQSGLNQILSGQAPAAAPMPAAPTTPAPYVAGQEPTSAPATPYDFSNLAPEARSILEPMVQRQEALESQLRQQQQLHESQNLAAQQAQITTGLASGAAAFVKDYSDVLSSTDMVLLETRVSQNGQFPHFMQQSSGDPAAAYKSMLEAAIWQDPDMRERVITTRQTASATRATADATRKAKASAVSGPSTLSPLTGASASAPTAPKTRTEMLMAAAAEVSAATGLTHTTPR